MGDSTSISWTDATWNVTRGCRRVSPGCENCYAERQANRFKGPGKAYEGLIKLVGGKPRWSGATKFATEHLADPLHWKEPRRIFVDSMSDLFHEKLTNEQIAAVFGVMAAAPQHTFQVLTKRAKRMREWFELPGIADQVEMFRQVALAGRIEEYFAPERITDLDEWPGYAITSKGRVISNKRGADREMRQQHGEQGHARVELYRDDTSQRELVHRLVLSTFDRAPRDGEQGCHVTGDATNNALWNLRWGTQSSNWDDSKVHGTRRRYSKLTDELVSEIRELGARGINAAEIGRRYCVSDTQVRNILKGKQWTPQVRPMWPLPSVWLGASVENQDAANERIPELLATPAAVRFLSCEPLLGDVEIARWMAVHPRWLSKDTLPDGRHPSYPLVTWHHQALVHADWRCPIHWVIAGCESGPGARPCNVEWLRSLRDQCAAAAVPYFLKQAVETDMGHCGDEDNPNGDDPCGERVRYFVHDAKSCSVSCGCTVEGSEDANGCPSLGFGEGSKRKSGGVIELPYLDGVQHAAFPEVQP